MSNRTLKSLENNCRVIATKDIINTPETVINKPPIIAKPEVVTMPTIVTKPKKVSKPTKVDKPETVIPKKISNVKCLIHNHNQNQILALPLIQCQILILILTLILIQCLKIWLCVFSLFYTCIILNKPVDNCFYSFSQQNQSSREQYKYNKYIYKYIFSFGTLLPKKFVFITPSNSLTLAFIYFLS